jgi:Cof subfamily protein (haloacid dehalogenase superfamily)
MIKLLATDLDGTLLRHHDVVQEDDIFALQWIANQGVTVCFASGRILPEMNKVMNQIGIDCHAVTHNGAMVYTSKKEKLFAAKFEVGDAKYLYDIGRHSDVIPLVFTSNETILTEGKGDGQQQFVRRMLIPCQYEEGLSELIDHIPVCKISLFGNREILEGIHKQVREHHPHLESAFALNDCLDFTPAKISKGSGLKVLLRHFGIRAEELACVGDTFNDIPMFKLTPHSFAMSNGPTIVQQCAKEVVSSVSEAICRLQSSNRI